MLHPLLEGLARYHNRVAQDFRGAYPFLPYRDTLDGIRKQVGEGTAAVNVITVDGRAVAFCKIEFARRVGNLDLLYVAEDYRGSGLGDRLMRWALKEFAERGVAAVDLKVVEGNPAKRLYEKFGFRPRLTVMTREME